MDGAIYLGLGSNLGDRRDHLEQALVGLASRGADWKERSWIYESEPVGVRRQPTFLNAVCLLRTALSPSRLLRACLETEADLGRVRARRWGPRTIDIDILLYGDAVIAEPRLQIPHPRMRERRFVLLPLRELAPRLRDPLSGRTVSELLETCADRSEVTPLPPRRQWDRHPPSG